MIKHSKYLLTTILILTCAISTWTHAGIKAGTIAPAFTLKSMSGQQVSLKSLTAKGHVMLVFWETECVYCFLHIKEFNALHNKYKDRGLTIATINFLGEHENAIREYVSDHKVEYLTLVDQLKSIDVATAYKVIGSPTIVVIAPDNKILYYGHKTPDITRWIP